MPEQDGTAVLQRYARIAGFLFLFYIGAALAGQVLIAWYQVPGDYARTAANVRASDVMYRAGLIMDLCGGASAIGLGWALYALLRPVDEFLSLFGMLWRVTEGIVGIFGATIGFARVALYTASDPGGHQEAVLALADIGQAAFPVGVTFFSFGSLIFFWLLLKSRLIARWLAFIGVVGSVCATVLGLTLLAEPDPSSWIQLLWLPLLIAEVGTGLVFMLRGANLSGLVHAPGRQAGLNR